jgi:hypothetical protein
MIVAMHRLLVLNRLRWYTRLPAKWAVLGLTLLIVCFPYPSRLFRHLQHWRDPNALIEPDAPALEPFVTELRRRLTPDLSPAQTLRHVERFVYEKIPYEWDWNTWGTADYLPTVAEVFEMGKEDCDGRAVVAASLLRRLGFEAELVTDFAHLWVKTDQGETMGPGKQKAIIATEEGLRLQASALAELPRALSYGVAVFPLYRELIVLLMAWLLLLRSHGGVACSLVGLALLLAGLFLWRAGGTGYRHSALWMQWSGIVGIGVGVIWLLWRARINARRAGLGPDGELSKPPSRRTM